MKLLLTSAGVKNPTIQHALVDLLGKPISESNALCIPTGSWGHNSFAGAWRFIISLLKVLGLVTRHCGCKARIPKGRFGSNRQI